MKTIDPNEAIGKIKDGSTIVFPGSCANPARFYDAFRNRVSEFRKLTVCSGLSLGDYQFLEKGLGENFHYLTWQASPKIRHLLKAPDRRKISYVPLRLNALEKTIYKGGPISPDVAVINTSLPQNDGTVNLGISVGSNRHFIEQASIVIAEMNPLMPITHGLSQIPQESIDYAFESDSNLATYDTGIASERDEKIVDLVLDLIPEHASIQLGIGAVPDRVLSRLSDIKGSNLFSGMVSQSLIEYIENSKHQPTVISGELAGNQTLYNYCHNNDKVSMQPIAVTHNGAELAKIDRFVSINSSVEIDLGGQSNGETLGPVQISGPGGSLDYIEAAIQSPGGLSIIALPSTTADGKHSKIVSSLSAGGVVTTPRFCVDYVVTEYGVANLRGKSLWERAEELTKIAHPAFRNDLAKRIGGDS